MRPKELGLGELLFVGVEQEAAHRAFLFRVPRLGVFNLFGVSAARAINQSKSDNRFR
jgi:hypothetical protein